MYGTIKNYVHFYQTGIQKIKLKSIKTTCHLVCLLMESSKIFVVALTLSMLHAFIYNVINAKRFHNFF